MSFTGRIGINKSQLGNIVLGIVDSFELESVGYIVGALSSKEIIIKFSHPMDDSVLNIKSYVLASSDGYVPELSSVYRYGSGKNQVVLNLKKSLTYAKEYYIQLLDMTDIEGNQISGNARSFVSNVQDPPCVVFACLGREGTIDITFDREIGPYSSGSSASVTGLPSSSVVPLSSTIWENENIPKETIRFSFGTISTDENYIVNLENVLDESGNSFSGSVDLTVNLRSPIPHSYDDFVKLQVSDAVIYKYAPVIGLLVLRVYFNCQTNESSIMNPLNWNVSQKGPHSFLDTINSELISDATDEYSALSLLTDLCIKYNSHAFNSIVHFELKNIHTVPYTSVVDLNEAITRYEELRLAITAHFSDDLSHRYRETLLLPNRLSNSTLSELILKINEMKSFYNEHLMDSRSVSFHDKILPEPQNIGQIINRSSVSNTIVDHGPNKFYVDLNLKSNTRNSDFLITCTIANSSFTSFTNPSDYTGSILVSNDYNKFFLFPDPNIGLKILSNSPLFGGELDSINLENKKVLSIKQKNSLSDLFSSYYELLTYYGLHIASGGAGHVSDDTVFILSSDDFVTSFNLDGIIFAFNSLKSKITSHINDASFHVNPSYSDNIDDVYDFDSLEQNLLKLKLIFIDHNASGYGVSPTGFSPRLIGSHTYPGFPGISLINNTENSIRFSSVGQQNLSVDGFLKCQKFNEVSGLLYEENIPISGNFYSHSSNPSLSLAIPEIGIRITENSNQKLSKSLDQDTINIMFSKNMSHDSINKSNVSVTPPVDIISLRWENEQTIKVFVSKMAEVQYSVTVNSLFDESGNPVLT